MQVSYVTHVTYMSRINKHIRPRPTISLKPLDTRQDNMSVFQEEQEVINRRPNNTVGPVLNKRVVSWIDIQNQSLFTNSEGTFVAIRRGKDIFLIFLAAQ